MLCFSVPALSEARVPRPSSRPPDTNAMPSEDGPTRCDWRIHKFKLSYFTMVQRSDFRRCLAALFYASMAFNSSARPTVAAMPLFQRVSAMSLLRHLGPVGPATTTTTSTTTTGTLTTRAATTTTTTSSLLDPTKSFDCRSRRCSRLRLECISMYSNAP